MTAHDYDAPSAPENSSLSRSVIRAVGKCRILAELGHGGMANVYLAVTQAAGSINKLVVLKALRLELAAETDAMAMFLDEARLAAQLNHPNVVQTYDVGTHAGRAVMVMEYLDGQPLSRILRECQSSGKHLSLRMALRIVVGVLEGLHYAHELAAYDGKALEIVHRDVSPQNVFVTYDGQAKVLDFGIAKATNCSTQTAAGVLKGKFAYMSPEQMTGEPIDRRADIYSVGCMLWAFATGQKLWRGEPDGRVLRNVISGDIPSPRTVKPELDDEIVRIVQKAMAHERDERYATALELQADLEQYADTIGGLAKPKEVGAFVSELFADARRRIKSLIETQLANPSTDIDAPPSVRIVDEGSGQSPVWAPTAAPTAAPSTAPTVSAPSVAPEPRPRVAAWWLAIGVGAGALLASAAIFWKSDRGAAASSPPAMAAAPAVVSTAAPVAATAESPAPAPSSALAMLTFNVSPAHARLFLDGMPLPAGVTRSSLPADGSKHTLSAAAHGHVARSLDFAATGDLTFDLSLPPAPPSKRSAPRDRAAADAANRGAPSASKADSQSSNNAVDCSTPFYLDSAGIKRVRAECR